MLKLLITKFWPALIPLLLYVVWLWWRRRKARIQEDLSPGFFDGPWHAPVLISALMVAGCFIILGLSNDNNIDQTRYRPAELRDGVLVNGQLD